MMPVPQQYVHQTNNVIFYVRLAKALDQWMFCTHDIPYPTLPPTWNWIFGFQVKLFKLERDHVSNFLLNLWIDVLKWVVQYYYAVPDTVARFPMTVSDTAAKLYSFE